MGEDYTSKEYIDGEIAKAVQILREDKYLAHSRASDERLSRIEEKLSGKRDDPVDTTVADDDDGKPPPKKPQEPSAKKRSLWWGDSLDS